MSTRNFFLLFLLACLGAGCNWNSSGTLQPALTGLSYPSPTHVLAGEPMAAIRPTVQGAATSYSIVPALPAGLTFSATTGEIIGTPIGGPSDPVEYTITAQGSNGSAQTTLLLEVTNSIAPIDINPTSKLQLMLSGVNPAAFNPINVQLNYDAVAGLLTSDGGIVSVSVNGRTVPSGAITVGETRVLANVVLDDGRNEIVLRGSDILGLPIQHTTVAWAGPNTHRVRLVESSGAAFNGEAQVTARLSDELSLTATVQSSGSIATFHNIPSRTLIFEGRSADRRYGVVGALGSNLDTLLVMGGFNAPSTVPNNDISLGLSGWTASSTQAVRVVPHEETPAALRLPFSMRAGGQARALSGDRVQADRAARSRREAEFQAAAAWPGDPRSPATPPNNDIRLSTLGEGAQTLSRTFTIREGTKRAKIRFRFVTSEVPGGYFGSRFNDYFSVSIRSRQANGAASEAASMNGLGLAAFDGSGATAYRTVSLTDLSAGDVVQVDVVVANVADGFLDSFVDVDFVEEDPTIITPTLAWNDASGGLDLTYTVDGAPLAEATPIEVYWASGPNAGSGLGAPIFITTVSAATGPGSYGPISIGGATLTNDPSGVTHLIAVADATVGSLLDARVAFGASADPSVVPNTMGDLIRDALRVAGEPVAVITSTARTPEQQARAMFSNLVNPNNTIAQNIANQRALYASPGDAVIGVFAARTGGLTREQALAARSAIEAAMTSEIYAQGPSNVSKHCGDPLQKSVVDVGRSSSGFTSSSGPRFKAFALTRASKVIDEPENNAYHIELGGQ